ncbi:MAG TPA: sugar ABC transporter substrate-binding protein, partial [Pseudolysinimonas sp.]
AEPNKHTQELYAALDSVVQAVLTDKNADIDALLKGVNTQIQALIDADSK